MERLLDGHIEVLMMMESDGDIVRRTYRGTDDDGK